MPVPLRHRAVACQHQRRHHPALHHLPLEVAANSVQTVAIAARTTPDGATSLLQIAKRAPEASTPVPLHHRASDEPGASKLHERSTAGATGISRAARRFGRAVSLTSLCCLRTSEIHCRITTCIREEPFGPIVKIHGAPPIDRSWLDCPSMSIA